MVIVWLYLFLIPNLGLVVQSMKKSFRFFPKWKITSQPTKDTLW